MLQCTIAIEPQEIRYANNRRRLVASSPTEQDEWELAFEYGRPSPISLGSTSTCH
jgi:hypothetical protein